MGMSWTQAYAHDSKEAFFTIPKDGRNGMVQVQAEFPWTVRTALLAYDTTLQKATTRADFDQAFFNYVKVNLILQDPEGQLLELRKVYEVEEGGHGHQSNFIFEYRGNTVEKITNTMLFNLSDQQINYHTILADNQNWAFETRVAQPAFIIRYVPRTWKDDLPWYIGGLLLLVGFGWIRRKR